MADETTPNQTSVSANKVRRLAQEIKGLKGRYEDIKKQVEQKTKYFEPSEKEFMINYRVENIERLVEDLKKAGVKVLDDIEVFEYGKFVHIMDPDGNKIELWEPIDSPSTEQYEGKTTK